MFMKSLNDKWNTFYKSGKIADYLDYAKAQNACASEVNYADNNGGRCDKGTPDR